MRPRTPRRQPADPYFSVETLEQRILFAADLPGVAELHDGLVAVETRLWQEPTSTGEDVLPADTGALRELVFVDARVDDLDALLADLDDRSGRDFEVILIRADDDAIARIGEVLAERRGIETLHVVSHGGDGELQLGRDPLDTTALLGRAEAINGWSTSFSADADVLIYGCELASSDAGRNFVDTLANLTGTDVAASIDTTGSKAQGGNWDLEYARGHVQGELAFSERLQDDYAGAFATYTVSNLNNGGAGSLRQAIADANASGTDDVIVFDIAGTVNLSTKLPTISDTVSIDATTAPGYTGTPVVTLDGSGTANSIGLNFVVGSDGSEVKGLEIVNFDRVGISLNNIGGITIGGPGQGNVISGNGQAGIVVFGSGASGNTISGNFVGTNAAGNAALGNGNSGIEVYGGANGNTIGGDATLGGGNLVSANAFSGIAIYGAGTDGNTVVGNRIGTDADGTVNLGNGDAGIRIDNAANNAIGGTTSAEGNVISGNGTYGLFFSGVGTFGNTVMNNRIGTNAAGTSDLGNANAGILFVTGSHDNTVGGTATEGNLVSGNDNNGILLSGSTVSGNRIEGNRIGTNLTGTAAIGNTYAGVWLANGAHDNFIGGPGSDRGNLISGNVEFFVGFYGTGVVVAGAGTDDNVIAGNVIGLAADGDTVLSNDEDGVLIRDGAARTRVGAYTDGVDVYEGNVISGNGASGVYIDSATTAGTVVAGNLIGTDATGLTARGNGQDTSRDGHGVLVLNGAHDNVIGGVTVAERNVISGNDDDGIQIFGPDTDRNRILNNYIGTDIGGSQQVANGRSGIAVFGGAADTVIGGDRSSGEGNLISGNGTWGVYINGSGTDDTAIEGNNIGTNAGGSAAIANGQDGIGIFGGAKRTLVGGGSLDTLNVISGNGDAGVELGRLGTDETRITGNHIGTDIGGTFAIGNARDGIIIYDGVKNTYIGDTGVGEGNLISGNTRHGVMIHGNFNGAETSGNRVVANTIGLASDGTNVLANGGNGLQIHSDVRETLIGVAGAGNTISGNGGYGIEFSSAGTTLNTVVGNFIGTTRDGSAAAANALGGVRIFDGARGNAIGGNRGAGEGNVVSGNGGHGIRIEDTGTQDNRVQGNLIGTDGLGTSALSNLSNGILIKDGATGNLVGGDADGGYGNVISGNEVNGIGIGGSGTSGNRVEGNLIGTNALATAALANERDGIFIYTGASGNTIGGTATSDVNLISGNLRNGVYVTDTGTNGNAVIGNRIGTDVAGTAAIANGGRGVRIADGAQGNAIGDGTTGGGNVIGANLMSGILVDGAGTNGNTILGNYVGVGADGAAALGNGSGGGSTAQRSGIVIDAGAANTVIGGTTANERNVIADNERDGIYIDLDGSDGTVVSGNYIGLGADGALALGNGGNGISVSFGAAGTIIGRDGASYAGNVISGNGEHGIFVEDAITTGTAIRGNYIGTSADGESGRGNGWSGVYLDGASTAIIGGTAPAERNVVSGNGDWGVYLGGTTEIDVRGNFIGTEKDGLAPIGNGEGGIRVAAGATDSRIDGNVISGNAGNGVDISGLGTLGNTLSANRIGTDVTGTVALGNVNDGINISLGASSNVIGGGGSGDGNVVSANGGEGIEIRDTDSHGNAILGNFIGTDATGTQDLGNGSHGILLFDGARNTIIGDSGTDEGNLIAGNDGYGIFIDGNALAATTANVIQANVIGLDTTGAAVLANTAGGIRIANGASGNTVGGDRVAGEGNIVSGHAGAVGITIDGGASTANVIAGNLVGTDDTGTVAFANGTGILNNGAADTIIGGVTAGEANLVSANSGNGIEIFGTGSTDLFLYGNLVGTTLAGTGALGNGGVGVQVSGGASRVTIGGTAAGTRNLIAASGGHGIVVDGSASISLIGNHIGTGSAGTEMLGNNGDGVRLTNTSDALIGGTAVGAGNRIMHSGGNGIGVEGAGASGNAMLGNIVYDNGALGIDLGLDGVTTNDPGDTDTGPNGLQNTVRDRRGKERRLDDCAQRHVEHRGESDLPARILRQHGGGPQRPRRGRAVPDLILGGGRGQRHGVLYDRGRCHAGRGRVRHGDCHARPGRGQLRRHVRVRGERSGGGAEPGSDDHLTPERRGRRERHDGRHGHGIRRRRRHDRVFDHRRCRRRTLRHRRQHRGTELRERTGLREPGRCGRRQHLRPHRGGG